MATIREHDSIVLTEDLEDGRFKAGDVGTVVFIHRDGQAYEVEFFTLNGETVDVVTVEGSRVRAVEHSDITHARTLAG
jgi:hypothetical protein